MLSLRKVAQALRLGGEHCILYEYYVGISDANPMVIVEPLLRTMRRRRRENTPPVPRDAADADKYLTDEAYSDTVYAKYYIGLVHSEDDGYALLFASRGKHM